jgi:hypothetical protein
MSFFDEIKNMLHTDGFPAPTFRALMIGDYAIHLEDVVSIKQLETENVTLRLKKGGLVVKGKDLFVKKYCEGDLIICGKIISVERI